MKYRHIIFDADHTLIDFKKDERRAFRVAFKDTPLAREEILESMWKFSCEDWEALGLNNVNDLNIRKQYHKLYYVHIHALFEHAKKAYALENADETEKIFYRTLCSPAHPREGAFETVKELAKRYAVSIATNGLSDMQRARLKEFMPYVEKLFISEEMNAIKPSEEFGNILLNGLGATAEECLFIGDSLTSDIALANKLDMDAVWYDSSGYALPEGYSVIKKIGSLCELIKIL